MTSPPLQRYTVLGGLDATDLTTSGDVTKSVTQTPRSITGPRPSAFSESKIDSSSGGGSVSRDYSWIPWGGTEAATEVSENIVLGLLTRIRTQLE